MINNSELSTITNHLSQSIVNQIIISINYFNRTNNRYSVGLGSFPSASDPVRASANRVDANRQSFRTDIPRRRRGEPRPSGRRGGEGSGKTWAIRSPRSRGLELSALLNEPHASRAAARPEKGRKKGRKKGKKEVGGEGAVSDIRREGKSARLDAV